MALYISDANGKLNKIAGNYRDDDTVEHSEVIYDKTSSDANINWGYTGGIPSGTTISKSFSKVITFSSVTSVIFFQIL